MKSEILIKCGSSAREVCGSVKVGKKNPKNVRWNDVVKAA